MLTVLQGDALTMLRTLPSESVQCVITSPPYWGLRDYGTAAWEGGDAGCSHTPEDRGSRFATPVSEKQRSNTGSGTASHRDCKCGARRIDSQIGLERTPELYVTAMVEVFREVRRVLRNDGTLWLNLGDSYAGGGHGGGGSYESERNWRKGCDRANGEVGTTGMRNRDGLGRVAGLKPKDLCGIPWRVAFALQQPYYTGKIKSLEDRIWLASIIDGEGCMFIHKRKTGASNGQGYFRKNDSYGAGLEVCNTHRTIVDRCLAITGLGSICTVEKESKHGKHRNIPLHRWNLRSNQCRDVIREIYPHLVGKQHEARILLGCPSSGPKAEAAHAAMLLLHNARATTVDFPAPPSMFEQGWYLRSDVIWSKLNPMPESVTDRPTKAHEYVFLLTKSANYFYDAEAIKEPAGEPRECGRNSHANVDRDPAHGTAKQDAIALHRYVGFNDRYFNGTQPTNRNKRSVWSVPTSPYPDAHFATYPPDLIKPMILAGTRVNDTILDPFAGSGTTGQVAIELGRRATLIELNPAYVKLINQRCTTTIGLPLA